MMEDSLRISVCPSTEPQIPDKLSQALDMGTGSECNNGHEFKFGSNSDDHDIHPQRIESNVLIYFKASYPTQCVEDIKSTDSINNNTDEESTPNQSTSKVEVDDEEEIDYPNQDQACHWYAVPSDTSKPESSEEIVDEKQLRLNYKQTESTEKKLAGSYATDQGDDCDPLRLDRYLRAPSGPTPQPKVLNVYMLLHPGDPTAPVPKPISQQATVPILQNHESELGRLSTYTEYPVSSPVFAITLAHDGFIYRHQCKAVDCYFCKFRINLPDLVRPGFDPVRTHLDRSPLCPLKQGQNCANRPVPKPEDFPDTVPRALPAAKALGHINSMGPSSLSTDGESGFSSGSVGLPAAQTQQPNSQRGSQTVSDSVPLTQQPAATGPSTETYKAHVSSTRNASYSNPTAVTTANASSLPAASHTVSASSAPSATAAGGSSSNGGDKAEAPPKEKKKLTYSDLGIYAEKPKRADMAVLAKRLATFTGKWKDSHTQTPQMLSEAGMYFAGYADCARCFFCGGGLKNWEAPDNPWIEHARWFPKCAYIRLSKGPMFVDIVQRKNKDKEDIKIAEVEAEVESKMPSAANISAIAAERAPVAVSSSRGSGEEGTRSPSGGPSTVAHYNPGDLESLEAENEDLKTQVACKICMDRDSSVVFLPCGHLVACTQCAIALKLCPLCRADIKGSVRAHMMS